MRMLDNIVYLFGKILHVFACEIALICRFEV